MVVSIDSVFGIVAVVKHRWHRLSFGCQVIAPHHIKDAMWTNKESVVGQVELNRLLVSLSVCVSFSRSLSRYPFRISFGPHVMRLAR